MRGGKHRGFRLKDGRDAFDVGQKIGEGIGAGILERPQVGFGGQMHDVETAPSGFHFGPELADDIHGQPRGFALRLVR